ncbi:calpastatin isoform X3 [Alosa pseudoharengus]|uniref:calpastatin isoform X3 n=1 Tax=Alosa pseudoharengus TaxID=34774 RepID=UPI003F8C3472
MPHRKRGHGRKKPRGKGEGSLPGVDRQTSTSHTSHKTTSGSQSQTKPATAIPAAQVAVKPAQYENAPASTPKPTGTQAGTKAAGGATVTAPASGGASAAGGATTQKGSPKSTTETSTPAKVAASPTATTKTKTTPAQETLKSTPITSSTSQSAKADASAAAKPAAKGGVSVDTKGAKPSDTKVQREVGPPKAHASAPAVDIDPLDALAGTLPTESLGPTAPVYTGPEVIEPGITSKKGVLCGERDDTLPPGYRKEDLEKRAPAAKPDVKPKEVTKPLSTDEALDSLSAGFMHSAPPATQKKETKVEDLAAIDALSAGFSNFAPPPPASTKSPAPPADKKAKMEKAGGDFSLMGALSSPPPDAKPKTDEGGSMSLDALGALGDTLAAAKPLPEPPKLRPEDIVSEAKLKSEKGVRVGEREDSLHPEYRFKEKDLKKYPAPKPEPSMDPTAALDILSGDFTSSSAAPAVHAPVITPSAPPQPAKVDDFSLDALAADFAAPAVAPAPQMIACDFGLVAPAVAPAKISAPAPPPPATKAPAVPAFDEGGSMSLDALSALGDTLAAAEPVPEPPKLRPEDIVSEAKLKSEKGVRVGEREDSLPPEYRFKEEDLKKYPAPKRESSMDPTAALDILSGDFTSSSAAPAVHAPVITPSAPPQPGKVDDFSLDALAGDFAAPAVAPAPQMIACDFGLVAPAVAPAAVQSSVCSAAERQLSLGTCDALDALSDTLMDTTPVPQPAPVPVKDIVKEKTIEAERLIKMGERDDSLPPEFRPSEEDLKALPKVQPDVRPKQKSMDDSTALDLLSSDFSTCPVAPAPPAAVFTVPVEAPAAPAPVLDALADTLTPQAVAEVKPKEQKPKSKSGKSKSKSKKPATEDSSALDMLSDQLNSDVVPTKKGGKS